MDSTNSDNDDDDFDPLLSKSSEGVGGNNSIPKQMSQSLNVPSYNDLINEGLSNPLYPYFVPQQIKSELLPPNHVIIIKKKNYDKFFNR